MITFYHPHRKALFNGFIESASNGTIESKVEAVIIGETKDEYVTRILESSIPMWDEMGKYETKYCTTVGFHKSRFVKWVSSFQLNLFES